MTRADVFRVAAVLALAVTGFRAEGSAPSDLPADVFAPAAAVAGRELPWDVFAPGPNSVALKLPADVFARPPGDDRVDVVLVGGSRAAVVRVHLTVGDRGYKTAWGDFAVRLHAYLDRDGDGTLTVLEANRAPWTNLLQSPFNGFRNPVQAGAKPTPLDADKNGKVTVEELCGYLRGMQDFDALGVRGGQPPDPRTESVFKHLDRDADKVLSSDELGDCAARLVRLDVDEDEVLALDELTPDRSPYADRFRQNNVQNQNVDPNTSPVLVPTTERAREQLATRLLGALGRGTGKAGSRPGKKGPQLGPEALGAPPSAFRAADADGDGTLGRDELTAYLADPTPDLEINATLPAPGTPQGAVRVEVASRRPGAGGAGVLSARPGENGGLVVTFEGAEIEFRANDAASQFPDNFFETQFTAADGDKNGLLDAKEVRGNFFLQRMFPVADRDGNGKMTLAELKAYNARQTDAAASRMTASLSDRGSTLHQLLDADHDNRLSVRELRQAPQSLRGLDRDKDGRVGLSELPRRSLVVVGRDDGRNNNVVFATIQQPNRQGGGGAGSGRPAWFVGMDRNRDGDVSRNEFLGGPEHFRMFDADGDGLIDATEAAKAP